jgi:hypothetical protein
MKCQKLFCDNEKLEGYCVCQFHKDEIEAGRTRAPPIRRGIDHDSSARKILLVDVLPDGTISTYDK